MTLYSFCMRHFPACQDVNKAGNKNASLDLRFQSLVWTAEYDVKTLVWTQTFYPFSGIRRFSKNALVWTGP